MLGTQAGPVAQPPDRHLLSTPPQPQSTLRPLLWHGLAGDAMRSEHIHKDFPTEYPRPSFALQDHL